MQRSFSYIVNYEPRCSRSIFKPISIKIMPPVSSALDLNFMPNPCPIFTPTIDKISVIKPMEETAGIIFTLRKAKDIPTASASTLVARARGSILAGFNGASSCAGRSPPGHSRSLHDSFYILLLKVMYYNRKKAQVLLIACT